MIAGASSGIGKATAMMLSERGWNLVVGGRDTERLAQVPGKHVLGSTEDNQTCGDYFASLPDGEIAAVYAAGYAVFGETLRTSREDWDKTLDANLTGMFEFCREAISAMLPRGGGRIVNVLSIACREAFPKSAAYVASKYGALGLTRSLAAEHRHNGILFTAFIPGSTDTPLWEDKDWRPAKEDMLKVDDVAKAIVDILELPRTVSYDEIVLLPPKGIL